MSDINDLLPSIRRWRDADPDPVTAADELGSVLGVLVQIVEHFEAAELSEKQDTLNELLGV